MLISYVGSQYYKVISNVIMISNNIVQLIMNS